MRIVFIGGGELTNQTAQQLLKNGYEVVIVEKDKERIDELSANLNTGFIHGDGSKPVILREADPAATDYLFCLTGNDQANIITSLVGRSLGYKTVVTRINDPSYEHICIELGLTNLVVPDYTIARYLTDMCKGQNPLEISALIKGEARIFSFVVHEEDEGALEQLNLPKGSKVIFLYRDDKFIIAESDTVLQKDDEVVILSHSDVLTELETRWAPKIETTSKLESESEDI